MSDKILKLTDSNYLINWFTTIINLWNVSETFLNDIARSFNLIWYYNDVLNHWITFWWKRFYNYWDDILMFEYSSLEDLKKDSENWNNSFKKKNAITSETIDWKQVLESSGYFEYNWKFYLLWLLYQDLNEDDNDENQWVYKWVIVNPERYFEVENEAKEVKSAVGKTIKK